MSVPKERNCGADTEDGLLAVAQSNGAPETTDRRTARGQAENAEKRTCTTNKAGALKFGRSLIRRECLRRTGCKPPDDKPPDDKPLPALNAEAGSNVNPAAEWPCITPMAICKAVDLPTIRNSYDGEPQKFPVRVVEIVVHGIVFLLRPVFAMGGPDFEAQASGRGLQGHYPRALSRGRRRSEPGDARRMIPFTVIFAA